ncbi:MAG: RNA methyltransferase [Kiritimatiellae bacterium]|nr:RNA methyltransferase [Kiritimatiellia bacterium]MDW8458125.1 RNA methyltransferase [Verrucomicrobiota bacterium]
MISITSLQNPRLKELIRLQKRPYRDERGLVVVEGYREVKRMLDNGRAPLALFFAPEFYQGANEPEIVRRCAEAGAELFECSREAFAKVAYRDRPEGLIALTRQVRLRLADLSLPERPLLLVAEAIEKPGNLGSLLRSADAAGVHAVIVCDRCTDIHNPNVVRSSIGTLFSLPVAEAESEETLRWLREREIRIVAATPHAEREYTEVDMTVGIAIVVGTEKFGLSEKWMSAADERARIPMFGQIDSLNVAAATTLLLYEAVRQRRARGLIPARANRL